MVTVNETAARRPTRHAGTKPTYYSEEPRQALLQAQMLNHAENRMYGSYQPASEFDEL